MSKKEKIFPLSTIGGRIQQRRKDLEISRNELYDLVYQNGMAASDSSKGKTVLNWESGKTELNYDTLKEMCKALKCSSDYLLGLDECADKSTQFIHDYTGLSEPAIKELHYIELLNSTVSDEPCLKTINLLLEQLSNSHNNIIDTLTSYLKCGELSENYWYDTRTNKLTTNKPPFDTERFMIPANSATFSNLLLMDIQNRIIELKKAPGNKLTPKR